jgi:1-acyl-sn-glycerol-3-phosphate acyltransferase
MGALTKDVRSVARGWRWSHRPLVPRSVEPRALEPRDFPTAWARTETAKAARSALQRYALAPLIKAEVAVDVQGLDVLDTLRPPVIFVANHSSHLDAPLVLTSLPERWRERTAIGAAADYFFDVWWRAAATALVFNAFPVERAGARRSTRLARDLITEGWNVVVFPEGTRSRDGWVGEFRLGAARLAVDNGVPAVPVAIRGSYQAMPRGRGWPVKGRPPVSVRLGRAVHPEPGEDAGGFNARLKQRLAVTLDEDRTTWWESLRREARGDVPVVEGPEAPRWRRVWEASRPVAAQGGRRRVWPARVP